MQTRWRKRQAWDWAKANASVLHGMLPENVCEAALATCRITLQGPKSVGRTAKNWGQWIRMRLQTFGFIPTGMGTVQKNHYWIGTDSHDAVNVILDCFGLSLDDVFEMYGKPQNGETRVVDLYDLVTTITQSKAIAA